MSRVRSVENIMRHTNSRPHKDPLTHTMHTDTKDKRIERWENSGTITGVSWQTFAVIAVELIDADAAVTTGIAGALVYVDGALGPGPSWLTGAIIAARLYRQ